MPLTKLHNSFTNINLDDNNSDNNNICSNSKSSCIQIIDLSEAQLRSCGVVSATRKRLRFDPTPPVIVGCQPELNSDERRLVWWSPQEVDCMISKALYSAEDSRKNKVLVDALDQALRDARRSALIANSSFQSDDDNFSISSLVITEQGLRLWCQYGHSRRGLERSVSILHKTTRANILKKARSNVVTLSQSSATANADEIRLASIKASRSSVIFATMIAMADAQAALYPFPASAERRRSVTDMKRCSMSSLESFASYTSTTSSMTISGTTTAVSTTTSNGGGSASPSQCRLKEVATTQAMNHRVK